MVLLPTLPLLHPGFRILQTTDSKTGCVNNVKEFIKMVKHSEDEDGESGVRVVKGGACNDGSSLE